MNHDQESYPFKFVSSFIQYFMKLNIFQQVAIMALAVIVLATTDLPAQKKKKNKNKEATEQTESDKSKDENGKNGIKPYDEVITDEAETDEGLFWVHKVDDIYYYEIPDSLMGREMLMVTRIAKSADKLGYGGEKANTQVLRWQKKDKKILLRVVSYNNVANDSLPIYESVRNSNFEPILFAFDIKAFSPDSSNIVIEINDLFTKDVQALGLQKSKRERYKVSSLEKDRSYIESIKSYPLNIEARHVMTYSAKEPPSNSSVGAISLEINNSMLLLPEKPMQPRIYDQRVGWFTLTQTDYGLDEQKAAKKTYLARWRLEPKDPEAFKRGELVEPVKPIVYYIDPATPEKWRPYLKQGVEDWNEAFEQAGFKNAIMAKDPPSPEEDPEWSPEDARYSVIRYYASPVQNAYGPHVSDPRSGEIIESDIGWFHNVMNLLRNWFFIQTAAVNEDARKVKFDDEMMGQLIRFVAAHEVGHTLGLPHNMGSSPAYPVDSLRSPSFTEEHGTAPSIMDYARFNYIAQPGDGVNRFYPKIGEYDLYAIKWGYRPIPDAESAEEEKVTLDQWILEKAGDPLYRFGARSFIDPSAQTEDLGDDAIRASAYGIENLKRIIPNLFEWTADKGKNYDDLDEMYNQVLSQFNRYMGHVRTNVGGIYRYNKTYDQDGVVFTHVPESKQKECVKFLNDQLFKTPVWIINKEILSRIDFTGAVEKIRTTQVRTLNSLYSFDRMGRMLENEALNGRDAYSILEMMADVRNGIWSELKGARSIDLYRRNLQKAYIDRLEYLLTEDYEESLFSPTKVDVSQSDIRSVAKADLNILKRNIRAALPGMIDRMSKYHLEDVAHRIEMILEPK